MKLSMSIIAQELPYLTLEKGSGKLRFTHCEILCGGSTLEADVLYLTRAGHIPPALHAPGGGGAICVGRVPLSMLPGLEVLTVDENVDLINLVNAVNAIFHKYTTLETHLHEAACGRDALPALIRQAAPLFSGNELLALSGDFRVLAQSEDEIGLLSAAGLPQPTDDGILPEGAASLTARLSFTGGTASAPQLYISGEFPCPLAAVHIYHQNLPACCLILSGSRRPFRPHDMELLAFIADFVRQICAQSANSLSFLPKNRLPDLLRALARGEAADPHLLADELSRRGWSRQNVYICLYMQSEPIKAPVGICNELNRSWTESCAFEHEGSVVCLVGLSGCSGRPETFFVRKKEELRKMGLHVGVSEVFTDLSDLAPCCRQSEIALCIGIRRAPSKGLYRFTDYSLDYLFDRMTSELDARHVASGQLRLLIDHDRENNTDYCRTLYSYINCGMNAMKCARELYIHRTTMVYRLNRIREMTGLDLEDAREMLYIHLSMILLRDEMRDLNIL